MLNYCQPEERDVFVFVSTIRDSDKEEGNQCLLFLCECLDFFDFLLLLQKDKEDDEEEEDEEEAYLLLYLCLDFSLISFALSFKKCRPIRLPSIFFGGRLIRILGLT